MPNPYRELFATPGARGFCAAGLIARLALPMIGIGIITMLVQLGRGYGLAGAVAAAFMLAYAALSPFTSRQVDRFGQRRVLPFAAGVGASGLAALVACAAWRAPDWTLFPCAALAGAMPSVGAMVRARWSAALRERPALLASAYSFETVVDEITYIAAPPLSVGLCVALAAPAGPLAAAALLVGGIAALVAQRGSEPVPGARDAAAHAAGSLLRQGDVRLLLMLMTAMGVIAGTVDIASVAFARQAGSPASASLVLSVYATGSCLAGLAFGALGLATPLPRLLGLGALATAAATLPLPFATGIASLSAMVFAAGLFFAPTVIVAMSLIERAVPAARLTEGITWLLAGLNTGVALGAALAGQVVDRFGTRAGFGVALGAGGVALLAALWNQRRMRDPLACNA